MFSLPQGVVRLLDEKNSDMSNSNVDTPPYRMRASRGRVISLTLIASAVVFTIYSFGHSAGPHSGSSSSSTSHSSFSPIPFRSWKYNVERDSGNYGLSDEQCDAAFPKLFDPIDQVIKQIGRPIELSDTMGDIHWGEARAMIYDNEIYVVDDWPDAIADNRKFATLHAINRAITATSSLGYKFPNIEFSLAFQDQSADRSRPNWAYDRNVSDKLTMMIPDFGLYAWPAHNVGTYSEVRKKIKHVEAAVPFDDKIPKLIWRGTLGFGSNIREALVNASMEKSWSAVQKLEWGAPDFKDHMLTMEDHCKYKFLAHTEGLAYSGRLKYLHNCESVIIAHEPDFETHDQHLMISSGPSQNYVLVKKDFSDLNEKMDWLLSHPEDAARIARNNIDTFRDRYLTPAAEGCYWRRLINEWGRHSNFQPKFFKEVNGLPLWVNGAQIWRGVAFESFTLMRSISWNEQAVG